MKIKATFKWINKNLRDKGGIRTSIRTDEFEGTVLEMLNYIQENSVSHYMVKMISYKVIS